ncbi:MAG: TRAP transporter large permease subunit [Treponema sp.]|jgi:tripartite ATP-independent transporter DctM subunit|nr:TRAP transporter large permease subunit [Treponema sp.]
MPSPRGGGGARWKPLLHSLENGVCVTVFALLALFPVSSGIARIFGTGIPGLPALTAHLLLLGGLLAGMITTRKEEHLSIAILGYFPAERVKRRLHQGVNLLAAFIVTIIAWCGPAFVKIALTGDRIAGIPDRVFGLCIPIGYLVIACRFARNAKLQGWKRIFPVLAVVLGTLCSAPAITKFFWEYDLPVWAQVFSDKLYALSLAVKIPALILLLAAALAGLPLFAVMGGVTLLLLETNSIPLDVVATDIYSALTNDNIIPIPLFTLAGFILSESRAGERLVATFKSLFSWLPGGMVIATVIICAFFTSFTGASGVTILALGGILFSILSAHGRYPEKFSIGLLTSVGSIGLLFPPSLPIILVGVTTNTNIFAMLLGGIIPGIILTISVILFGVITSLKIHIPVETFNIRKAGSALRDTVFEICLPFFLLAGYFSGIPMVEIGAIAVVYIFIAEVVIRREIKWKDLPKVFGKAVPIIGGVLAILALSQALYNYIVDTQAPENFARWIYSAVQSRHLFLLLLNLSLLVVGCLMDIFSAILIILPLIGPLGAAYGIDPVHLGIIFIINLEVGFLTPPVGLNLFLATYRFKKPFVEISRHVFPFMLIQLIVVALVTYVPSLSTCLVHLIKP